MTTPPADRRTSSRRAALRTLAGSLAAALSAGGSACAPRVEDGRVTASLWFAYGGKNREVLLSLVEQFHAEQSRYRIKATYQGDYFESLAKLCPDPQRAAAVKAHFMELLRTRYHPALIPGMVDVVRALRSGPVAPSRRTVSTTDCTRCPGPHASSESTRTTSSVRGCSQLAASTAARSARTVYVAGS